MYTWNIVVNLEGPGETVDSWLTVMIGGKLNNLEKYFISSCLKYFAPKLCFSSIHFFTR